MLEYLKDDLGYLLWNMADMFFILRYMNRLYGKPLRANHLFRLVIVLIILFTTVSMRDYKNNELNIIAIAFMSTFLLVFYPPGKQVKLLFTALLFVISGFWSLITYLVSYAFHFDIAAAFINHIGFWVLLLLAARLQRGADKEIPFRLWGYLMSIPLASIAVFACVYYVIVNGRIEPELVLTLGIPLFATLLYINIMVFFLFDRFAALAKISADKIALNQQIAYQEHHYVQLADMYSMDRTLRHDMKNNIRTALYLLDNKDEHDLRTHLNGLSESIGAIEKMTYTNNTAMDSILNIKIAELAAAQIKFDYEIAVPQGLKISFQQSTILFGNIFDNAKEACLDLPSDQRWVHLHMSYLPNILLIKLRNPTQKPPEIDNGRMVTTKRSHQDHGLGLLSVQRVADDFHGIVTTEHHDKQFEITIMLYNV